MSPLTVAARLARASCVLALAFGGGGGGCSALLDWQECSLEAPCPGGFTCVASTCEALPPEKEVVVVDQPIAEDTAWSDDKVFELDAVVYVEPGVTLSIRPGTLVRGEPGAALVVQAGARIDARGTREAPIVFTSAKAVGQRAAGDWGGVVLLGRAPVGVADATLPALQDGARGAYGGSDEAALCGVVEFVRVEFAGDAVSASNRFAGLTLAGCGSETLVSDVQVHASGGVGVAVHGGGVGLARVAVTGAKGDGLTWSEGWDGTAQFVVVQQPAGGDTNAMRGDTSEPASTRTSAPTVCNFTLVGPSTTGLELAGGTAGTFTNGIVSGQRSEGADIVGGTTAARLVSGELAIAHTLFYDIGQDDAHFFPRPTDEGGAKDDDDGFDEDAWLRGIDNLNVFGADPQLPAPFDAAAPSWTPPAEALTGLADAPPAGLDPQGRFLGAFAPGAAAWTDGWTAFPTH